MFVPLLLFAQGQLLAQGQEHRTGTIDPFAATIERMSPSVIRVVCFVNTDPAALPIDPLKSFKIKKAVGTGFFISRRGDFLTAGHVLQQFLLKQLPSDCIAGIYMSASGWKPTPGRTIQAKPFVFHPEDCALDPQWDIAICQTIGGIPLFRKGKGQVLYPIPFELQIKAPAIGTDAAFSGFPGSTYGLVTERVQILKLLPSNQWPDKAFGFTIQRKAMPGNSGSPLYLANGKAIGIVLNCGVGETHNYCSTLSSFFIQKFLDRTTEKIN